MQPMCNLMYRCVGIVMGPPLSLFWWKRQEQYFLWFSWNYVKIYINPDFSLFRTFLYVMLFNVTMLGTGSTYDTFCHINGLYLRKSLLCAHPHPPHKRVPIRAPKLADVKVNARMMSHQNRFITCTVSPKTESDCPWFTFNGKFVGFLRDLPCIFFTNMCNRIHWPHTTPG